MRRLANSSKGLLVFLLCLFLFPNFTSAEDKLEVKVEYGVENKVQMGKGHPVKIEIINHGNAIKGDLVVFSSPAYNMAGSYIVPVELEAGDSKLLELSIKGTTDYHSYNTSPGQKTNYVSFYEGGVEKGKEVKLSGNPNAKPRYLQDNRFILGVLSNNHDAVNYIKLLRYHSEPMELLNIKQENIPFEAVGLEMYDAILVHDFALSMLTAVQQQALKEWVMSGGALIYDTKVGINQDLGELTEFLLLKPDEEVNISSINSESTFPQELRIFTGQISLEETEISTKEGATPVSLIKAFGNGKVTQIASNLSDEQWQDWDGLNNWWSSVIGKASLKTNYGHQPHVLEELSHQLSSIGETFPSSIVSVPLLIVAFIVYLILLIPVLYVVLRKMDKREQAWWIIPTVAIFTSIGVFAIGAKDRIAGTQINEASILVLDNSSELAAGYGAVSILTNSGGTYNVETELKGTDLFPVMYGYDHNFEMAKNYAYLNASTGSTGSSILFNNVEYWSIRSGIGKINSVPLGTIEYDLGVTDGKVIGKITNHLDYELKDAYLLSGRNSHDIGDIRAGEEATIEYELQKGNVADALSAPQPGAVTRTFPNFGSNYPYNNPTNIDKSELDKWKKFQMLELLVNRKDIFPIKDQPVIIGFVTQEMLGTKVNGKTSNKQATHLVAIPVKMNNEGAGSFSFTEEHIVPTVEVTEGESGTIYHNGLDFGDSNLHLSGGSYTLTYSLPDMVAKERDTFNLLKVKLRTREGELQYFIENQASKEWEPLENISTVSFEENVKNYVGDDQSIKLAVKVPSSNDRDMIVPAIQLEGELNND